MSTQKNPYLGVGVYSVAKAARLTQVPAARILRWMRGYTYRSGTGRRASRPVWIRQLPDANGALALGFLDLMEVRFVDAFRRHGVSLKTIRIAAERAARLFHDTHPLSSARFRTDGRTIFADIADESGEAVLLDIVRHQYAFEKVLARYLYEGLDFSEDDRPLRWWPSQGNGKVVLDPVRSMGKPIVAHSGVPTETIFGAFCAGETIGSITRWYDVNRDEAQAAIDFEESLAA